jgi:UDP-N-acetylglucosamine 2-epimerase (non-hydrolysing)
MKNYHRKRTMVVMGTRPEAIKLAPVVKSLQKHPYLFETLVVATAQHRQMLDQVLNLFQINPELDLHLMRPDQELSELTGRVLQSMTRTLKELRPDLVMVQGDTTTAFATSLAAFYLRIPVAHVEAGLRSNDLYNPFPEEINRRLITSLAEVHLAPTPLARQQLLGEGISPEKIVVTGNTVVDAINSTLQAQWSSAGTPLACIPPNGQRLLLVTAHRRESWGENLENICQALKDLVDRFPDIHVVYPVHLNPQVNRTVHSILAGIERIHLLPPLDYLSFIHLMERAYFIMTDSGGIVEEAPTMHKPLLIMRSLTERPEAVQAGIAKIVGTTRKGLVEEASRLLSSEEAYRSMVKGSNPYGDGRAAERIVTALDRWAKKRRPLLQVVNEFHP